MKTTSSIVDDFIVKPCKVESLSDFIHDFWHSAVRAYTRTTVLLQRSGASSFRTLLDTLEAAFSVMLKPVGQEHNIIPSVGRLFALDQLQFGFFEYLKLLRDKHSEANLHPEPMVKLVNYFFFVISFLQQCTPSYSTQERVIEVMDCLLWLGMDFNGRNPTSSSLWQIIIEDLLENSLYREWFPSVILDWCLRHGADPDLTLGKLVPNGPHSHRHMRPECGWELLALFPPHGVSTYLKASHLSYFLVMNRTAPLCQLVLKKGGDLTLDDLLSSWFPGDEYFPSLLENLRSCELGSRCTSASATDIVGLLPRQFTSRTDVMIRRGLFMKDWYNKALEAVDSSLDKQPGWTIEKRGAPGMRTTL
jgi:hypothetical protein